MIKGLALKIARKPFFGMMIGYVFANIPYIIPWKKVITKDIVQMNHPVPSYQSHNLIVPRIIAKDVFDLSNSEKISEVIKEIVSFHHANKEKVDFLVLNGGRRQEVKQVHIHMYKNSKIKSKNSEIITTENLVGYNLTTYLEENKTYSMYIRDNNREIDWDNKESLESFIKGIFTQVLTDERIKSKICNSFSIICDFINKEVRINYKL